MSPKINDKLITFVRLLKVTGENEKSIKQSIKQYTNLSDRQVRRIYNDIQPMLAKEEVSKVEEPQDQGFSEIENFTFEEGDEEGELTVGHYGLKTLDELLDRCGINKSEWDVKSFRPNSWPANTKNGVVIFSQVKAYLERKISRKAKISIEDLKNDLKKSSPTYESKYQPSPNSKLLEICLPDLHLGKYGEKDQVGNEYNMEIAKRIFLDAVSEILSKAEKYGPISKIAFPIGNDFLNIDNAAKTTTAGTPQDCDVSFSKMFKEGRELLVTAINMAKKIAPVDVLVVPGNHDSAAMLHIGDSIECWFHNDKTVNVYNSHKSRKYYSFGENLIIYCHGDKEKQDKLPLIAATEEPILWSKAKYREIRVGHLHHEIVKEHNGVKIRVVPSLSGNDVYHYDRGYTGNIRVGQGFLFDYFNGLESIFYSKPVN